MISNDTTQPIVDFIRAHDFFVILGHKAPDADCAGSQLALALFLNRIGKRAVACSAGPFNGAGVRRLEPFFTTELPETDLKSPKAAAILTDCAELVRTEFSVSCPVMAIDHHSLPDAGAIAGFIDSRSPSATLLVLRVIEAWGETPTKEEADLLFLGFCTDSGFFRFLTEKNAEHINQAARLVAAGASPVATYEKMEGSFSFASRRYTGYLVDRSETYHDGKVILVTDTDHDRRAYGGSDVDRDSSSIYALLLATSGVDTVALLKEDDKGVTVGLRSRGAINVADLAGKFGGGGHVKAAGFLYQGLLSEIRKRLLDEINAVLNP